MTERKPKNYDYYTNLRRTNRKEYHQPRTQQQMLQDRQALGERFYDEKANTRTVDDVLAELETLLKKGEV